VHCANFSCFLLWPINVMSCICGDQVKLVMVVINIGKLIIIIIIITYLFE